MSKPEGEFRGTIQVRDYFLPAILAACCMSAISLVLSIMAVSASWSNAPHTPGHRDASTSATAPARTPEPTKGAILDSTGLAQGWARLNDLHHRFNPLQLSAKIGQAERALDVAAHRYEMLSSPYPGESPKFTQTWKDDAIAVHFMGVANQLMDQAEADLAK